MRKENAAKMYNLGRGSRVEEDVQMRRLGRCKVLEHKSGSMRDELKGGATSFCQSQIGH